MRHLIGILNCSLNLFHLLCLLFFLLLSLLLCLQLSLLPFLPLLPPSRLPLTRSIIIHWQVQQQITLWAWLIVSTRIGANQLRVQITQSVSSYGTRLGRSPALALALALSLLSAPLAKLGLRQLSLRVQHATCSRTLIVPGTQSFNHAAAAARRE